jgi:transcriptional regulator with XRE-family HTH domain
MSARRRLVELYQCLAANVRARREAVGLTQEALAEEAQIELRYVQKIEAAAQGVSLDVLLRLADALDTTPDRLLRTRRKLPKRKRGRPPQRKKAPARTR